MQRTMSKESRPSKVSFILNNYSHSNMNMETKNICNLKTTVKLNDREGSKVIAYGELQLLDDDMEVVYKIRGYTIVIKEYGESQTPAYMVNPPAYGPRYTKAFIVEDRDLFKKISDLFIQELKQENGGLTPKERESIDSEKIADQIPF